MTRKCSLFFMTILLILSAAATNSYAQTVLTRHGRPALASAEAVRGGGLPAAQVLQLDIVLTLPDRPALQAFLKNLHDPASATYRRFLSAAEFTQRFGPTQADYDAVADFARANGLEVVGGSRDGMDPFRSKALSPPSRRHFI